MQKYNFFLNCARKRCLSFPECHAFHFYEPSGATHRCMHYNTWNVRKSLFKHSVYDSVVGPVAQIHQYMCHILPTERSRLKESANVLPHAFSLSADIALP